MELDNDQIRRYSRHLILPEVGLAGQKKICRASVLCIGAGGLGSPIAMYLAAAGVGRIGIVEFDTVDFSNLQRQIIHGTGGRGPAQGGIRPRNHQKHQPDLRGGDPQHPHQQRERARNHREIRHRRGRHGQFSDALPHQRRLRAAQEAERLWLDFPF